MYLDTIKAGSHYNVGHVGIITYATMLLSSNLASPFLNLIRTLCKQTVDTLIRRHNLRCLTWVCTVCISLEKMDASRPVLNNK